MNQKQTLNFKVKIIAIELYRGLVSPEEYDKVTWETVQEHLPKASFSQDMDTGVATTGLSIRGIRKILKKNPNANVIDVCKHFGLPHEVHDVPQLNTGS